MYQKLNYGSDKQSCFEVIEPYPVTTDKTVIQNPCGLNPTSGHRLSDYHQFTILILILTAPRVCS